MVHHTSNIGTCNSPAECKIKARKIQDLHMDDKGYDDVAYNFFIDPFGSVLVGRGFDVEGGHTYRYNCDAYGVNFMGYFRRKNPTILAIEAFNNLAIVSSGGLKFNMQTLRHLCLHNYQLSFQIMTSN